MSFSAAAKIGGAGVVAAGLPTSIYLAKDHIFLYEIERKIINGEIKLTVGSPDNTSSTEIPITVAKVSESSNKWSCLIKAKVSDDSDTNSSIDSTDKTKLQTYIKKRIPTSDSTTTSTTPAITDEEKNMNLKTLVWSCSSTRTKTDSSIESEWIISVKKSSSNLTVSFFGKEEQANETT